MKRRAGSTPLALASRALASVHALHLRAEQTAVAHPGVRSRMAEALIIRRLSKTYVAGKPVLRDIDVGIAAEDITAIIGPSGTGKSTLIRCINRLVEPTSGEILFEGRDLARVHGSALRHARRQIGMVFQEYNLVERLTVMENLLSGRLGYVTPWNAWRRRFPPEDIARAQALLETVGLTGFANRRADALSGGQRQRVGIARAVMQKPRLLLADEPTSSLDPKTSVEIMQLLADIARSHRIPVLINMHDVSLARRFADRILGMEGGRIVFDGAPGALSDGILKQIYGGEDWLH
jgi:phosphonate transport system ATP-binding protein